MSILRLFPGWVAVALAAIWIVFGTMQAAATSTTAAERSPGGPVLFLGDGYEEPLGLFQKPDFFVSLIEPARAFVSSTGGADPNDQCSAQPPGNHACSAIDYPAGEEQCSVNGDGGGCSAQGGTGTQYCSTRNGGENIKCSVIGGEGSMCSSSSSGAYIECSASTGVPGGACSVFSPGGDDGHNECSAYCPTGGTTKCSAFAGSAKCSVVEDANDTDVCTVMMEGTGASCSAFGANTECSTMMNDGTVQGMGPDNKCKGRQ